MGCELQDEPYTVDVSGTRGTVFSGTCQVIGGAGTSSNQDAAGTVPRSFRASGVLVSCSVQNKGQTGTLVLTIKRANGEVVATSSTSQSYGVALAAGQ